MVTTAQLGRRNGHSQDSEDGLNILAASQGVLDSFDCDCQSAPLSFDNDCHHPDLPPVLATADGGPYVLPSSAYTAPLPHGFTLAHTPYAAGPAVLGPQPYRRYRRFRDPAPLANATDHHLARLALLHPLAGPPLACAAPPTTLTAWPVSYTHLR